MCNPINDMVQVKVKKLYSEARIPIRATSGSAGFDIYSIESVRVDPIPGGVTIHTGLAVELPPGYEIQVRGRSGLAFRDDIFVHLGTVDSDYRGEIMVRLWNLGSKPFMINKGDRVAQIVINQIVNVDLVEVEELIDSERGIGGLGHTGK